MGKPPSFTLMLLMVNVMLGSIGQILIKHGTSKLNTLHASQGFFVSLVNSFKAIFTPYVFLGFCVYAVSSVLWIKILSQTKLSFAYPTISLSYVVVVTLSAVLFHEKVPWIAGVGLLLICGGVSLIGLGYGALK